MKKIINSILHRFKEDSLTKRTELVDRTVEYKELKDIKTGLVFWTEEPESSLLLKKLVQKMPGVKFDKLCFVPAGVELLEADDMVVLRNEDLAFGGKIMNDPLHTVLARKYDLLIDFTSVASAMIQYVLTTSQAACIAGMKKEGGSADIVVDGVKKPMEFIDRLTEILAQIKKY